MASRHEQPSEFWMNSRNNWFPKKQNNIKTCTKSPKEELPSKDGNRCVFDQKRKIFIIK